LVGYTHDVSEEYRKGSRLSKHVGAVWARRDPRKGIRIERSERY